MDKKLIGFMSYARTDDSHENGKLSEFREHLCYEVRLQSGVDQFDIFQDHLHIVWGEQWQQRLGEARNSLKVLIPIITPKFFKSDACRAEVARFALLEKQLGRTDLIFPVYYVSTAYLDDKVKQKTDEIAQVIASHQHLDWRELRHDSLTSPDARRMLAKMAEHIVAAMERGREHISRPAWGSASEADDVGKLLRIRVNNVVQRLRWIEPGEFLMGSPEDEAGRFEDEGPQHRVTISQGFWLADTACTQELWQAVMNENPSAFHDGNSGGLQHPVECVSWDRVQSFLKVITAKLPGYQVTLPTEAEWEYACRAGSKTAFSFGETISTDKSNFDGNRPYANGENGEYRGCTLPVTKLKPNEWGLFQMHGNVCEWCADGVRTYEDKTVIDPGLADAVNPAKLGEAPRALRGGSWYDAPQLVRSASRCDYEPDKFDDYTGFRLVCRPTS